ncbi:MAG: tRNA 2-thiocytidine biosynthesis TtcA family protein [Spirochaetia bacterium]|jgi:tRNA 2-thiocytidine biosynthesis protein TtcA|nr:tRNA 2-thiocytidine biosynthesis TtcA family protein [Spirochaetia bacterium]
MNIELENSEKSFSVDNVLVSECKVFIPELPIQPLAAIERNIITIFRKKIWSRFTAAVVEYKLLKPGDKIAIAISGGKDSLLMAKLFQELKKHGEDNFEVEYISMDPGFSSENRKLLKDQCNNLGIPVKIFDRNLFKVLDNTAKDNPCYLCAKMRRGSLYSIAQELGCNKLALGHHFDDVIETVLLNVFYSGRFQTMMPKLKSKNFPGLELIRPLYNIREEDILAFASSSGLSPMNCGCVVAAKKTSSKRREIKELIKTFRAGSNSVEQSIFNSTKNVFMDAVIGWREGEGHTSFLDSYDDA